MSIVQHLADPVRALGYEPGDNNEADALALLGWALASAAAMELV